MANLTAMVNTTATDLDYSVPELWASDLLIEAEKLSFWNQYEGAQGSGMPIIRKDDLTKAAGDRINVQTLSNLTGTGVTGVTKLKGTEEKLILGQITIVPDWIRHAVSYNKDAKTKVNFEIRNTAKNALARWLADQLDQKIFTAAVTGATHTVFGGDATSTATLNAGDEMSCKVLDRVKTVLKKQRALPLRGSRKGTAYYGIVISADDAYQLRQDSTWVSAQSEAGVRGEENNPLFTGLS
jgi:N4-gp56 family major capsid protein